MAKVTRRKKRRKRTTMEKIWIVISILLAISMVAATLPMFFGGAHF